MTDDEHELLMNRLGDALAREAALYWRAMELQASILETRKRSGNPFFYSGSRYERPENSSRSITNYTGYTSHEPALALFNELRLVRREIARLQDRLGKRL